MRVLSSNIKIKRFSSRLPIVILALIVISSTVYLGYTGINNAHLGISAASSNVNLIPTRQNANSSNSVLPNYVLSEVKLTPYSGPDKNETISPEASGSLFNYFSEPAPMGIADYGLSTTTSSGGYNTYSYSTPMFVGNVGINSLYTNASSVGTQMTFQLNVVLVFENNGSQYVYWIQDVAFVNTSAKAMVFVDNIWNLSSSSASMYNSTVSGSGTVSQSSGTGFYWDQSPNQISYGTPASFSLRVESVTTSSNKPSVDFQYNDGSGWITYDSPVFIFVSSLTSDSGFVVNGNARTPLSPLDYDAELIMGGPGGGTNTVDQSSNVSLQLEFWNGHNFQEVKNAFNFGSNTAEGISNVISSLGHNANDGSLYAGVSNGSGSLAQIWNTGEISILNVISTISSGYLKIGTQDYSFTGGDIILTLAPGIYPISLYDSSNNNQVSWNGTADLLAGRTLTINVNLFPLTIQEQGLPSGIEWGIELNGIAHTTTGTSLTIYIADGTYAITPISPTGYYASN